MIYLYCKGFIINNIRFSLTNIFNPILGTSFFVLRVPSRSEYPAWILKRDGLESSGQRQIPLDSKNKSKALFSLFLVKKNQLIIFCLILIFKIQRLLLNGI